MSATIQERRAAAQAPRTATQLKAAEAAAVAGTYVAPDGSITLNADGTYSTSNTAGVTLNGTYSVSGNVIVFTGSDGSTGDATIENGVITNRYGSFVKQ